MVQVRKLTGDKILKAQAVQKTRRLAKWTSKWVSMQW